MPLPQVSGVEPDAALRVREALELPSVAHGRPETLTPSAGLDAGIRWAHIIGQDNPGNMLQGGELVLSTLPKLTEGRQDLLMALRGYLADLDEVGAAALAIEILPDRPRLIEALRTVAAEREGQPDARQRFPLFLFSRVVRFVDITESVHRELVARQLGMRSDGTAWDPLVSATTNLLDDLAATGGLPETEISARASALGIPADALGAEPAFVPLVFRADLSPGGLGSGPVRQLQALSTLVREVAAKMRVPALVGSRSDIELSVLIAHGDPARLCREISRETARRRSQEPLPRFVVGTASPACQERIRLADSPAALAGAADVTASAALLSHRLPSSQEIPEAVQRQGYWKAADLGLRGLLVHLTTDDPAQPHSRPRVGWFLEHQLAPFRGEEGQRMRDVVLALVRTGGNKAELARELSISRPTLYARIERIERAVGAPLAGETLSALHVALLLDELRYR